MPNPLPPEMSARAAADVFESMIDSGDIFFEQDEKDAARVAITRLRATCGTCRHFVPSPPPPSRPMQYCRRWKTATIPTDGSGFCHEWQAKVEHTSKAETT